MLTYSDILVEIRDQQNVVVRQIREYYKLVEEAVTKQFVTNNGCKACRGRGWVVVWDTMDSMSGCYAEYGCCPREKEGLCNEKTRFESGLASGYDKYDRNRGVPDPVKSHQLYTFLCKSLEEIVDELATQIHELEYNGKPNKGNIVVVVKGRKAPIGFVGRLFWWDNTQWGTKVGVKNDAGEVAWTYLTNIERVYETV